MAGRIGSDGKWAVVMMRGKEVFRGTSKPTNLFEALCVAHEWSATAPRGAYPVDVIRG